MKRWLTLAVAALMLVSDLAFSQDVAHERVSLRLGIAENTGDIPALIALDQGFYRDEGLDVTAKAWPAGKQALEAMFRHEVDIATVADTPIVLQSFRRYDFVVIATFSHNNPYRLVANRDSGIHVATDLRGHRIGVMVGTTPQFFLHSLLADLGLSIHDVTEVDVSASDTVNALEQGRVDAIAAFDPHAYYAQLALGTRAIVMPYERDRHEETFNYVTWRTFPEEHPTMMQRLLRATLRAIQWSQHHRQEAIAITARHLRMDATVLDTLWDNYRHDLSLDQVLILSLEDQARWAIRNNLSGGATTIPNYLDFIDTAPIDAVLPAAVTLIR